MPYGKSNKSIQDAAFKLRSGNSPLKFKEMGSSPVKDTEPHTGLNPPHKSHTTEPDLSKNLFSQKTLKGIKNILQFKPWSAPESIPINQSEVTDPITPPVPPVSQYTEEKVTDFTPFEPINLVKEKKKVRRKKKQKVIKLDVPQTILPKPSDPLPPKKAKPPSKTKTKTKSKDEILDEVLKTIS